MYRPNEIEEKRLFELSQWIENAAKENVYSSYIVKEISTRIKFSWEDIDYRKELCSKDLESTKQFLLNKYSEASTFSDLLKQKIDEIEEKLCPDVYDYFMRYAENHVHLYLAKKRYHLFLMVESGWLPRLKSIYNPDLEKEADEMQKLALTINEQYIELCDWLNSLKPNDVISQKKIDFIVSGKSLYIANLFGAKSKKDPLEYVKNEIIKRLKHGVFLDIDAILDEMNTSAADMLSADAANLYPNQEKFYVALESWASSLTNPYCREWIVRYLENGRNLPFYQIRVFKYIKDINKAKEFLIEQYEKKLEKKHKKNQERSKKTDKYWKKRDKAELRFYKNLLKETGSFNFIEETEESANYSNNKVTDYPLGYSGTWAYDEAGYSNDDIDTIFDGDPDAYWNID